MKTKLRLQSTACVLVLLLSLGAASAQMPPPFTPAAVDPATGLPLAPAPKAHPAPENQWITPGWKDLDITLTNVDFRGLPASEVARNLRDAFKDSIDIMIAPASNDSSGEISVDPGTVIINLQLKNVTASEVFRAMNLIFEAENSPFRWQLTINGAREFALLGVIPDVRPTVWQPGAPRQLMIYYVGDLIGDGGMTLKQISDTLADVNEKGYGGDIYIAFHDETQLVIVKGTSEQISAVHNTLDALKLKMLFTLREKGQTNNGPKSGGGGGLK